MTVFMTAALLAAVCCGKPENNKETTEPDPEPQPVEASLVLTSPGDNKLSFSVERGSAEVTFTCTDTWTATTLPADANWVSIYPHSGAAGSGKITVTVTANESLDAHAATLYISYADKKAELSISQDALSRLRFNYTGAELLPKLAATYKTFLEDDLMPESFEMDNEGVTEVLPRGYYFEAMCLLLKDIAEGGDAWKTKTYALTRCYAPGAGTQYETYAPNEISLEQALWINDKQYSYAQSHGKLFANYCTVDGTYFSFARSLVVTARILSAFQDNGVLPEKVSSWQSDFLRGMTYDSGAVINTGASSCKLDDPVVVAARDAAIAGKTTTMEKAVAIFEYARDVWEWEDYYNTRKGAVKTMNEKGGNCCDLSHAIISMARSAGIPARYVHGPSTVYPSGSVWGHVWAELFVDGTWYICDASNNSCTFGVPVWDQEKTEIRGKYKDLPF